jgi:hypothetical protein
MAFPQLRPRNAADTLYLDLNGANTSGSALLTAADKLFPLHDGSAIGGKYLGSFLPGSVTPEVEGTLHIEAETERDPWHGWEQTVALDGVTPHKVAGANLVFSDAPTVADSDEFEIDVGDWLGLLDQGNPLGVPPGSAHVPATEVLAKNVGTTDLTGCYAVLRKPVSLFPLTGAGGLDFALSYTNNPVAKIDGSGQVLPYVGTFPLVAAGRCDYHVDGAAVQVRDLADPTQTIFSSANGTTGALIADGEHTYIVTSGALHDVRIRPSLGVTGADSHNLFVQPILGVQIAPDATGLPGTLGTADVALTFPSATPTTVPAGQSVPFWYEIFAGEDHPVSNPWLFPISFIYRDTRARIWRA